MDEEKKWMLITYYCPTHGDSRILTPIEIIEKEIFKTFVKKDNTSKNWLFRILFKWLKYCF